MQPARKRASMFDDVKFSFAAQNAAITTTDDDSDTDASPGHMLDRVRQIAGAAAGGRGRGRGRGRGGARTTAALAAGAEHVISDDAVFDELHMREAEAAARKKAARKRREGVRKKEPPPKRLRKDPPAAKGEGDAGEKGGDVSSSLSGSSSEEEEEEDVISLSTSSSESRSPSPAPRFSEALLEESARAALREKSSLRAAEEAIRRARALGDSDSEAAITRPPDATIMVSVEMKGLKKLKMRSMLGLPFLEIVKAAASDKYFDCNPDELRVTWGERVLAHDETPLSVRMTTADASVVITRAPQKQAVADEPEQAENVLVLKVRGSDGSQPLEVKIRKTSKFRVLMEHYAKRRALAPNTLRFSFDGDALDPDSTPEDLDVEDGDIIDVEIH